MSFANILCLLAKSLSDNTRKFYFCLISSKQSASCAWKTFEWKPITCSRLKSTHSVFRIPSRHAYDKDRFQKKLTIRFAGLLLNLFCEIWFFLWSQWIIYGLSWVQWYQHYCIRTHYNSKITCAWVRQVLGWAISLLA